MSTDTHLKTAGRNSQLMDVYGRTTAWLPFLLDFSKKVIKTKILSLAFIGKEVKFECQGSKVRSSHIFLAVRDWLLEDGQREKKQITFLKDYVQTIP